MKRLSVVLVAALALAGCRDEMLEQPRYDPYDEADLFRDGKVLQNPPVGTIAQDRPEWMLAYRERPALDGDLLRRGRERYGIFCSPCHGYAGYGDGTVPNRGFPEPPSFHSERLRQASSTHFFNVMTAGYGAMYSYAARVPPPDRWAIAAYIRALQVSQQVPLDRLPEAERVLIEERLTGDPTDAG